MKNRTKKLLKMFVSLTCTLALAVPSVTVGAAEEEAKEVPGVDFYPVVQSMTEESQDGMKLDGTVDLVIHGTQIDAAVPEIKALLDAEGIEYVEAEEVTEGNATIFITSDAAHCDACGVVGEDEALTEEQGYVLVASNSENEKGQVTIIGADGEGAYYGILTLKQMFEQKTSDGRIAEIEVSDWPDVKLRGFVEGFYGFPWTYEGRLGLMEDCGELKMNTYIYAPKDDPYHRDRWRELYPEEEAENIRKLAAAGHETNVTFCWSVHPGNGFNYNTDDDFNAIIAKFEQLYNLGVRQFGISYDDLGGADYYRGREHAEIINRVNEEFVKVKGDVKPLIVVATRYCAAWGPDMNSYFKPFYSSLDEDVVVMWTGNGTMSVVSKAAYEWPKTYTGVDRNLASWWNYPVNDYCDGKLLMSPLETLYTDVDNLSGFFLNPMSQAEASKVAIFSGADYSWNIQDFDYMESWKEAIVRLVPDCNEAFERFADNLSYLKDGFEFDESRYLTDKINALNTALQNGEGIKEAAEALKAEFELMKEDVVAMRAMENEAMLADIQPHLDAYDVLADAGRDGMTAYIAAVDGDIALCLSALESMKLNLAKTAEFTIDSLETNSTKTNVVEVGVKRIKPMLELAEAQVQAVLMEKIAPSDEAKLVTNLEGIEATVELTQGNYVVSDLTVSMKKDDYVGIKLPKAMKLSGIEVTGTPVDAMSIQTSLNGIEWTNVNATATEEGLVVTDTVAATYVRVVCNADQADMVISNITLAPIYDAETTPSVTTDLGTYQTYYIGNAMDGNMNSKFYSSAGTTAGSYVRVDLGAIVPIYDTTIYYAANPKGIAEGVDGFKTTKFEISEDGVTWVQVGEEISYTDYEVMNDTLNRCAVSYNAEGQLARYLRFSATESYDNWVQVYEIEYNKTATNLGDGVVELVESTMDIVGSPSLYDGDLTTAPVIGVTAEGDSLTYAMTTTTNVGTITMLQDADALSGAAVSVQKVDGTWVDLGTFDVACQAFEVNEEILAVKLTFAEGVEPVIYEIIVAEPKSEEPDPTPTPTPDPEPENIIPVSEMTATAGDEELENSDTSIEGPASLAIDENESTIWHTNWYEGPNYDNHWLQLELSNIYTVDSFRYLPRQTGNSNGIITSYKILVSMDGEDWTEVAEGTWAADNSWKVASFDPVKAKYVRLKAEGSESDIGIALSCAAEVRLTGTKVVCQEHTIELVGVKEVTCTEDGYTGDEVCINCGYVVKEGEVIKATGHAWGEWVTVVEPTETEAGYKERVCSVCDEKETEIIPEIGGGEDPWKNPFTDVSETKWYYNAVAWGSQNDVVAGIKEDMFYPTANSTRAQIVSFLWRAEGRPEPTSAECKFTDVNSSKWYYKAVLWATEKGYVAGYTDTTFVPNATCKRAEMATFLWRMAGKPVPESSEIPFFDVPAGKWYETAAQWAYESDIVSGYDLEEGKSFAPDNEIARAETVTMLYRYYN